MSRAPVIAGAIGGPVGGLLLGGLWVTDSAKTWVLNGGSSFTVPGVVMCEAESAAVASGEMVCYNAAGSTLWGTVGSIDPLTAGGVAAFVLALVVGGVVSVIEDHVNSRPQPL
jgi:hypothetical protein